MTFTLSRARASSNFLDPRRSFRFTFLRLDRNHRMLHLFRLPATSGLTQTHFLRTHTHTRTHAGVEKVFRVLFRDGEKSAKIALDPRYERSTRLELRRSTEAGWRRRARRCALAVLHLPPVLNAAPETRHRCSLGALFIYLDLTQYRLHLEVSKSRAFGPIVLSVEFSMGPKNYGFSQTKGGIFQS